jgi:protein SCO1/2
MRRKLIYLFLALLLPGLIFVFLRKFGKNEFNIPVYYEAGVEGTSGTCGPYLAPYKVADSVLQIIGKANSPILVVTDTSAEVKRNLTHLKSEFGDTFSLTTSEADARWLFWVDCVFLLQKPWTAVLIDAQGRIRGYYAPASREEADRLMVELRILLKQY